MKSEAVVAIQACFFLHLHGVQNIYAGQEYLQFPPLGMAELHCVLVVCWCLVCVHGGADSQVILYAHVYMRIHTSFGMLFAFDFILCIVRSRQPCNLSVYRLPTI